MANDGARSVVDITRPNNATPYTAGDVVGPTLAAITFPLIGVAKDAIMLTSVSLRVDVAAIPSGMTSFLLHLYDVTPPSALADNAPWDLSVGDRAAYCGFINLGSPADFGSTLYCELNQINKQIRTTDGNLYGYLVTVAGYTPTALATKRIKLHSVGL